MWYLKILSCWTTLAFNPRFATACKQWFLYFLDILAPYICPSNCLARAEISSFSSMLKGNEISAPIIFDLLFSWQSNKISHLPMTSSLMQGHSSNSPQIKMIKMHIKSFPWQHVSLGLEHHSYYNTSSDSYCKKKCA